MEINKGISVVDYLSQLEAQHAERATLIALLRKELGLQNQSINKERESSLRDADAIPSIVTPKYNGSADPDFIPLATHVVNVLRNVGQSLTASEIRDKLEEQNIDTSKPNFMPSLHTALKRRKNETYRKNSRWFLYEWGDNMDESETNIKT